MDCLAVASVPLAIGSAGSLTAMVGTVIVVMVGDDGNDNDDGGE